MTIKEDNIKKYISNVNFKSEEWSLSKIKEDMRKFLGEEPAIDVKYDKDVLVNETTGEAKEIRKINKVLVVFYDTDEKFKKIEFKV